MARKALSTLIAVAVTLLIASTWTDIVRYLKIKRTSVRPGMVPAGGRKAYPQRPGSGAQDGTGEFDSARRGGGPPQAG